MHEDQATALAKEVNALIEANTRYVGEPVDKIRERLAPQIRAIEEKYAENTD